MPEDNAAEVMFLVQVGEFAMRLTAKKPSRAFHKAIVAKAIAYHNEKMGLDETVAACHVNGVEIMDVDLPIASVVAASGADKDDLIDVKLTLATEVRASKLPVLQAALRILLRTPPEEQSESLRELTSSWAERGGWMPAPELRRPGLLWSMQLDDLIEMRAAAKLEHASAEHDKQSPFRWELDYQAMMRRIEAPTQPAREALTDVSSGGGDSVPLRVVAEASESAARHAAPPPPPRTIPRIELESAAASSKPDPPPPLPREAFRCLQGGMCCVLANAQLWPRAEACWGRRGYLADQLSDADVRVVRAPYSPHAQASIVAHARDEASGGAASAPAAHKPSGHRKGRGVDGLLPMEMEADDVAVCPAYDLDWNGLAETVMMSGSEFFESSAVAAEAGHALLLQHDLLAKANAPDGAMAASAGLGGRLIEDVRHISAGRMQQLRAVARCGEATTAQLTCATAATGSVLTLLRHEPCDCLHLQITGRRRFVLFPPTRSKDLAPYPAHHPLDRAAQNVASPKRVEESGAEVVLEPGEVLFLPAYWFFQEAFEGESSEEPVVGVAFRFDASHRHEELDALPVRPSLRLEMARQLEVAVADYLGGQAQHVPTFMAALHSELQGRPGHREQKQLSTWRSRFLSDDTADQAMSAAQPPALLTGAPAMQATKPPAKTTDDDPALEPPWDLKACTAEEASPPQEVEEVAEVAEATEEAPPPKATGRALTGKPQPDEGGPPTEQPEEPEVAWPRLASWRPEEIDAREWEGLFEWVLLTASLLIGAHNVLPFVRDLCSSDRWTCIWRRHKAIAGQ